MSVTTEDVKTSVAQYIAEVVAAAPPLTDKQRTKLAELLRPVRRGGAE